MEGSEFSALWASLRGKDGRERDRVIVGVGAAFVLVATANGELEASETARFLDVVLGSRLAASDAATVTELGRVFETLARSVLASPELGRRECLRVLSELGFDPARSEIIWSATSAALVADAQLDAAERRAEVDIREALRIRPTGR